MSKEEEKKKPKVEIEDVYEGPVGVYIQVTFNYPDGQTKSTHINFNPRVTEEEILRDLKSAYKELQPQPLEEVEPAVMGAPATKKPRMHPAVKAMKERKELDW